MYMFDVVSLKSPQNDDKNEQLTNKRVEQSRSWRGECCSSVDVQFV